MRVENIVFLLEEKSSKNLIDAIVPQILPEGVACFSYSFDGKSDLEKNIAPKMRGWLKPNTVFLTLTLFVQRVTRWLFQKKFRNGYNNPDSMVNAAEELSKITGNAYRKIQGSKDISEFLRIDGSNKSTSFNMLVSGIRKLVG